MQPDPPEQSTEAPQASIPTKVCRHCSVQAQTEADRCPSCGKPYRRTSLRSVVVGLAIGAAIGGGVYLIGQAVSGNGGGRATAPERVQGVTFRQARMVPLRTPKATVLRRLGKPQGMGTRKERGCIFYVVTDQAHTLWRFCFLHGKLVTSSTLIQSR